MALTIHYKFRGVADACRAGELMKALCERE
jgi:hypothetical protein